jgi:hypothetical protein
MVKEVVDELMEEQTMLFLRNIRVCRYHTEWQTMSQNAESTKHVQFCLYLHSHCGFNSSCGEDDIFVDHQKSQALHFSQR